ncbi:MAG: hypothetical protein IKG82_14550 [Oscillospiraceae bacterium]|nr:hypothetical protein [Oscillospiraceae bacterium]
MKHLRIKDNWSYPQDSFSDILALTSKIGDKTLGQLEGEGIFVFPELVNDADDLTKDQMILQSVDGKYRTSNVMGFLGAGNERLTITSRFASGEHDFFFQYMLEKVLDFPNIVDLKTDASHENRLFHLLLFLFPYYLKQAMRKGLFKTYIRKQYNDPNVKGVIDIPRHISKNTPFIGNIAYNQREYSYDNTVTELIRHTIEFIKRKPYGRQILVKVKDEVQLIVEATQQYELYDRRKVVTDNSHNPIRHAYYREYRALQHLCLLILKNQEYNIGSGSHQINGILFDGAWLWEEYINSLVGEMFYHPTNRNGGGKQWLFSGNKGLIYPDFIGKNQQRIIADAKYKPFRNIYGDDYLQLLAYMLRFDAKAGYYFYPENSAAVNKKLHLNSGTTYEENVTPRDDIFVKKLGLIIPDAVLNYADFRENMKQNEDKFITALLESNPSE